jgi:ribosomal protein S18 acetylase RimI-like enzyme
VAELLLRPMTEVEFDEFFAHSIRGYADSHVAAGNWSREKAEERAAAAGASLLPAGFATENMLFLMAEAAAEVVGWLWLALPSPGGAPGDAWIYDIEVVADQRGKGYGRALLAAAETELRARGVVAVSLQVFGYNLAAKKLYETSGYQLTSQLMRKELA